MIPFGGGAAKVGNFVIDAGGVILRENGGVALGVAARNLDEALGALNTTSKNLDAAGDTAKCVADSVARRGLVGDVGESAKKWLGDGYVIKRSDTRGFVAISEDGTRKLRMDFDGHGFPPHGHLEVWDAARQRWKDAIPGEHHLPFK